MKRTPALRTARRRDPHAAGAPAELDLPESEPDVEAQIAAAGGDFVAALTTACHAAADAAQVMQASIRLIDGIELLSWGTSDPEGVAVERIPIATSIEGLAVSDGKAILCDDAETDDRADPRTSRWLNARSWLVLPLMHGERVVGTLSVSDPEPSAFSQPSDRARELAAALREITGALTPHLQTAAWFVDRCHARDDLQSQINEAQIAAEMMTEGVIVFGPDGRFRRANNAAGRLLGLNLEQLAGRHVRDALRTLVRENGSEWPGEEQPPAMTLATGTSFRDVIMGVHKPQGVPSWVSVSSRSLPDAHGAPNGVVVVLSDCTERRGLREQLAHATLHDEATGLPNRRLLHLELDDTIDRSRRQGLASALVQITVKDFELLRGRVGVRGADDVLRMVGERVAQTARDGEMVARNGEDEFSAVLGMLSDTSRAAQAFLDRVDARLAEPMVIGSASIQVQTHTIVSVFPDDGHTAEALLRHSALARLNRRHPAA